MKKAKRLIKGGLLIGICAGGLFLFGMQTIHADVPADEVRDIVERVTNARPATNTQAFAIDPIVLEVHDGMVEPARKPLIVGLAPNNTLLRIFIDDILVDSLRVTEVGNSVALFIYEPKWLLARDTHSVYVQAIDDRGTASSVSAPFLFHVNDATVPQIAATTLEEGMETADELLLHLETADNLPRIDFGELPPTITKEFALFLLLIFVLAGWVWSETNIV